MPGPHRAPVRQEVPLPPAAERLEWVSGRDAAAPMTAHHPTPGDAMDFNKVEFERSFGLSKQLPPSDGPEIAFAGRSNVGKSSLLNLLFNRKGLAKVSQTPGKTSTINFFKAGDVRFVDLPGYGYARVSKSERGRWAELIEGYFNQDREFALVCALIDIRHPASELDENMIAFLQEAQLPFMVVLTKADKLSSSQCHQQKQRLKQQLGLGDDIPLVMVSSLKKTGVDELRRRLAEYL